ncbi:hypothetical protein Q9F25_003526 [Vibrio cholerae]|uniref:hypothetical protein n=1 Tax=Vibrio mimicus TaxID=674 RepID=UPI0005B639B2|nr:hypothetical protein [Vibrio mimicus]
MDTLTFISTTLGQFLSWPVVIFILGWMYRAPIIERLSDITKIKTKHFEADFGARLKELEIKIPPKEPQDNVVKVETNSEQKEFLKQLTDLLPNAAILESWRNVEKTLDLYFSSKDVKRPKSGQSILRYLDYDPNFPPQLVSAYQELRMLRNKAAHAGEGVSTSQAREFEDLASRLTFALISAAEQSVPNVQ